jgi:hypothetical protein
MWHVRRTETRTGLWWEPVGRWWLQGPLCMWKTDIVIHLEKKDEVVDSLPCVCDFYFCVDYGFLGCGSLTLKMEAADFSDTSAPIWQATCRYFSEYLPHCYLRNSVAIFNFECWHPCSLVRAKWWLYCGVLCGTCLFAIARRSFAVWKYVNKVSCIRIWRNIMYLCDKLWTLDKRKPAVLSYAWC